MNIKKGLRIIGRVLLILLLLIVLLLLITTTVYHIKLNRVEKQLKEEGYYNPVSVGDHALNMYACGDPNGQHTIIALAGWGDGEIFLGWRQMTEGIEKENRLFFLDRAGYGLSDDTRQDMTAETVVEEYRTALKSAGIEAPYLLMGHSMGGVYATYWESKYPDEIEAVIFVDGEVCHAIPEDERVPVDLMTRLTPAVEKLGLVPFLIRGIYGRFIDKLPEKEREQALYMMCKALGSRSSLNEMVLDDRNADFVWNEMVTNDIPKLYISATIAYHTKEDFINDSITADSLVGVWTDPSLENSDDDTIYAEALKLMEQRRTEWYDPYIAKLGSCRTVELPGDHVIFFDKPDECCKIAAEFVDELDS